MLITFTNYKNNCFVKFSEYIDITEFVDEDNKSINSFRAFIYFAKSFPDNEVQIREVIIYHNIE